MPPSRNAPERADGGDAGEEDEGLLPATPPCPFCRETRTELVSPFGSGLSVATYWCRRCGTAFELMKWKRRDEREEP